MRNILEKAIAFIKENPGIIYSLIFPKFLYLNINHIKYLFIFILYVLMSMTNPILFNSMGGLVILWYWCQATTNEV